MPSNEQPNSSLMALIFARFPLSRGAGTKKDLCVILWNMHGGGVNKLETGVQILELF
jgi:hypothetical protein